MPTPSLTDVFSHWSKLFENLQISTAEFYANLEEALKRREIPKISTSRHDFHESGILSAKREYLRVNSGSRLFDICAAPFGNGYFFSWWLAERPPSVVAAIFLFAVVVGIEWLILRVVHMGFTGELILALLLLPAILFGLATLGRLGVIVFENGFLATPGLSTFYRRFFKSLTYYEIDTMLMFQAAVHAAVLEVIDGLTTTKGLRALSEDERKPILRQLTTR